MAKPPFSGRPRSPYFRRNTDPYAHIRRNQRIRAPEIRVVLPDGRQAGVMPTGQALAIAQTAGLDLVEVAPNATPPVCRVMDFGKYVYEQQKKAKDSKGSSARLKEVKFRPRVDTHDYMTKLRHAENFLDHGNKVKLTLTFRGREMAHTEIGYETIKRAVNDLLHIAHPDNEARLMGRNIIVMMTPLPANKRKRKYTTGEEPEEPEEQDEPSPRARTPAAAPAVETERSPESPSSPPPPASP